MNNVVLMGRLTKDIEVRETSSGLKVTNFTVAVDRASNKDETDFVYCQAWRGTAEFLEKYAKKGNRLLLTGSIRVDTWQDDDDEYHSSTTVNVNNVELLDWNDAEKTVKNKSKKYSK